MRRPLQAVLCVLGVLLLLSLAVPKSHSFGTHFRTPEVRQSTVRHIFAAHTYDTTCEHVTHDNLQPAPLTPIAINHYIEPLQNLASAPEILLVRPLSRLKLYRADSSEDPLL